VNGVKHLGNLVGSLLPADVMPGFAASSATIIWYFSGGQHR
jgi:hypothetical protein